MLIPVIIISICFYIALRFIAVFVPEMVKDMYNGVKDIIKDIKEN